ncbi:response regulator [Flavobacterium okayamense]|uniref:histidine kinase n=1 Tax=Flavobacterium okayamense TaxID=2830782 RepID=A0ABN6HW78_9FLAO|nr:response regulator [Flavobacterium okayamense]BCY28566.1 hypothetical protein KK2020170_14340 [Flavobacterium okayamense]
MKVQERQIFKSSNEIYNNEVNTLLKLNSESYTSISIDVTYWDEFVDFIGTRDLNWFNTSVASVLDAYKLEYVGVYTTNGEFITKVSTTKINTKEFIPKEAIDKLLQKKIDKFYLKTPDGIVEVFGATIHPSSDPFKNKTEPAGCFFMVRLLDNEYFADIEKITTSNIKFYKGNEVANKTVFTVVPLNDFKDELVTSLYFKRAYNIDFWITKTILLIMGFALIISWLVYYIYANKWSKLPLSFIKKILRDGDQSAINSLKNIKGEFRYIGKLFEDNQIQTKELEIAKTKAEESDRLKSAFLMNLSHEIRTPMNAVVGFSELLSNKDISEAERIEYTKVIQESGKNLIDIIDDLVEMSKIDSNLVKPNLQPFDLQELVSNIYKTYDKLYSNSEVEFKLIAPENFDKKIITDKTKLSEIITNLMNNSHKFTPKGFIILEYNLDEKAKKINFCVKDSGIGIKSEFQENIFKRFSKVNSQGISGNEGLGLGLAISKAYIDMLGGEITFESKDGIGTTFNFSIPLMFDDSTSEDEKLAVEVKEPVDLGKELVILVAEDDNINYLLIERILKPLNAKIIRAKDGVEAVNFCKENNEIDLILMDIRMPNMNGYEAFVKIREFNKNIPIIAQTSYSFEEELTKIESLGFTDFISKPIQKNKLHAMVLNHLKK